MDVLMLCTNWKKAASPRTITALKHVYCHYIGAGLRRRGCRLYYAYVPGTAISEEQKTQILDSQNIPEVDHTICCEQDILTHHARYNNSRVFFDLIRQRTAGLLTSVRDRPREDSVSDMLFTAVETRGIPGNVLIGAAADPVVFAARQTPGQVTYCLDNVMSCLDITPDLESQVLAFAGKHDHIVKLPLRTSQRKLANLLSFSHVFIPTHPESFGMTVIEAGMAGCLVVSKRGFIHSDILRYVEHIEYDQEIPWQEVTDQINPTRCRATAMRTSNRWDEIAGIVYDTFANA